MKKSSSILMIILGTALVAAAFGLLILPAGFAAGGVTGLASLLASATPVALWLWVLLFNGALFAVGWKCFGRGFAARTVLSSFLYPLLLAAAGSLRLPGELYGDRLLVALGAGVLLGAGSGLVIRGGGSEGGFDVLGIVLNSYLGLPLELTVYLGDLLVIILQAAGSDLMSAVYGIAVVLSASVFINKVLMMGRGQGQMMIFSDRYATIRKVLLDEDIGLTMLDGAKGFTGTRTQVILAVAPYGRLESIKKTVAAIDPEAFVVIDDVHAVFGRGYTMERRSLAAPQKGPPADGEGKS